MHLLLLLLLPPSFDYCWVSFCFCCTSCPLPLSTVVPALVSTLLLLFLVLVRLFTWLIPPLSEVVVGQVKMDYAEWRVGGNRKGSKHKTRVISYKWTWKTEMSIQIKITSGGKRTTRGKQHSHLALRCWEAAIQTPSYSAVMVVSLMYYLRDGYCDSNNDWSATVPPECWVIGTPFHGIGRFLVF